MAAVKTLYTRREDLDWKKSPAYLCAECRFKVVLYVIWKVFSLETGWQQTFADGQCKTQIVFLIIYRVISIIERWP